jgi:SM-20-related protein
MRHLNIEKLRAAKVENQPFAHLVVPDFIDGETVRLINATYPPIGKGGSYVVETLDPGSAVKKVIDELDNAEFEAAIAQKFEVDLVGKPKMYSLRGQTRAKDGRIHTDSKDKVITVLLYFNESWPHRTGRLRLLRDGKDLENYVLEVPPDNGTLLVFKRADNSWHGHYPFVGQRRALQMNWMTSGRRRGFHALRHKLSAAVKRWM